jgi:hypothetical protein
MSQSIDKARPESGTDVTSIDMGRETEFAGIAGGLPAFRALQCFQYLNVLYKWLNTLEFQ